MFGLESKAKREREAQLEGFAVCRLSKLTGNVLIFVFAQLSPVSYFVLYFPICFMTDSCLPVPLTSHDGYLSEK